MDVWKIVLIVVLLAILLFLIGQLNDLNVFSAIGGQALDTLATPTENLYGVPATWAPIDVGRDLFSGLFTTEAMGINVWEAIIGAFAAAFIVIGIAILIKIIGKVTGS